MPQMMRSVLFAAALALATTTASAQTVATVFSDIPTVVKSGDTVDVTDAKGRTLRGKIGVTNVARIDCSDLEVADGGGNQKFQGGGVVGLASLCAVVGSRIYNLKASVSSISCLSHAI
jgi:hypothetical protein